MKIEIISHSLLDTQKIAFAIAKNLFKGAVITLDGDLGAGKTTFTQSVALALGVKEKVNSPTFNILKCYFSGSLPLYHIDAYRLEEGTNKDLGLEEFIEGNGICLIEWPNFISEKIDGNISLNIEILNKDLNTRIINISSNNDAYQPLFDKLLGGQK